MHLHYGIYLYPINGGYQLRLGQEREKCTRAGVPFELAAEFAWHYHVRYYDEQGKFSDEYDLVIEKAGAVHNASWITNGKVNAGGVGMEVKNGLATGWRGVADF